jgi:putative sterol carrier protein
VALDRCAAAMPYVVGKKVGAPDGTCVLFIVVGLLGRHIPVVVSGGRAGVVDATPADVTVTLTMAQDHFWRLCFGRMDYVKILATGEATVTGDTSLGHRVLGDMSFMV